MAAAAAIASTALQVIGQIAGGVMATLAADKESAIIEEQALLSEQESIEEADRLKIEGAKFKAKQSVAFTKSGVSIKGSPLLVLEETRRGIDLEVSAELRRGQAIKRLGFQQAEQVRASGRAAF